LANYIDFEYTGKKADPDGIIVWEQNYETGEIEEKRYSLKDYLYFYIDAIDDEKAIENITSQRGTKVQKIIADSFRDLKSGESAKYYHGLNINTYESDISPLDKCMLDNYGKDNQKAPQWNLALYDIETDVLTEQTFMEMREGATREINAVSVWYAKPNKFFELAVVPPMLRDEWDWDAPPEKRGNSTIYYFDNEPDMLDFFFELNKKYHTVALGAWNGDFFDTDYIFKRCKQIWNEKTAAQKMGRFSKVRKQKVNIGDKDEILHRPIGLIWYDCLIAYKKNGPELESFALAAVAEEEGVASKLEFEGNFETLYHGDRKDRERFLEITPKKSRKKLMKRSYDLCSGLVEEVYPHMWKKVKDDPNMIDPEKETRCQILITDYLESLLKDDEFLNDLGEQVEDFERFVLYKKFRDTFNLFLDYSIQDTQILYDLEMKLKKFDTLSMLAQYNVSYFQDIFSTLKQSEQGLVNFAHQHLHKVVMDREYDKYKQPYNKYVDPELLRIRAENDYRITPEDDDIIKEMKKLVSQAQIPGAHVLLPQIGLISFDEEVTPKLAKEFKTLKNELKEIDKLLEEMEED